MRLTPFVFGAVAACGPAGSANPVSLLGDSPTFTVVADAGDGLAFPRDLAFDPEVPSDLWVVDMQTEGVVVLSDPGTAAQKAIARVDAFGNHFMANVSSMAFGAPGTFASCQESRNTYDDTAPKNDFMGPALWPSDLNKFAKVHQDDAMLGSHLDMLHQSPNCMGIEHETNNEYWVFDGLNGVITWYDFAEDHGYGGDDHSDGRVRRYTDAKVRRVPGVPGDLVRDPESDWLYIADTGGHAVTRLDTSSGTGTKTLRATNEPLAEFRAFTGATVETFASGLDEPSGLAIHGRQLFVGDHATGEIVVFDIDSGEEISRAGTDAEELMGLTFGPDDQLWYVDAARAEVVRVDP